MPPALCAWCIVLRRGPGQDLLTSAESMITQWMDTKGQGMTKAFVVLLDMCMSAPRYK